MAHIKAWRAAGAGLGVFAALALLMSFTNVVPATAAALQQVLVTNTATNPVLTRNVDQFAQTPFQQSFDIKFVPSQLGGSATFTVPSGKRLVLEDVSGNFMTQNGMVVDFSVTTTVAGVTACYWLVLSPQGAAGGYPVSYTADQQVRLYAGPGTTVTLSANRQLGGSGEGYASVSGYLTPAS
jgi:hypothetical protein